MPSVSTNLECSSVSDASKRYAIPLAVRNVRAGELITVERVGVALAILIHQHAHRNASVLRAQERFEQSVCRGSWLGGG